LVTGIAGTGGVAPGVLATTAAGDNVINSEIAAVQRVPTSALAGDITAVNTAISIAA
jgi:hypothetical protein